MGRQKNREKMEGRASFYGRLSELQQGHRGSRCIKCGQLREVTGRKADPSSILSLAWSYTAWNEPDPC
jgi:hypothetical protein